MIYVKNTFSYRRFKDTMEHSWHFTNPYSVPSSLVVFNIWNIYFIYSCY